MHMIRQYYNPINLKWAFLFYMPKSHPETRNVLRYSQDWLSFVGYHRKKITTALSPCPPIFHIQYPSRMGQAKRTHQIRFPATKPVSLYVCRLAIRVSLPFFILFDGCAPLHPSYRLPPILQFARAPLRHASVLPTLSASVNFTRSIMPSFRS